MFRTFLIIVSFILNIEQAWAKKEINVFAYSRTAPETTFYTAEGRAVKIKDFNGDLLLVTFWSRNCLPCISELDELNSFVNKTRDSGIKMILVSNQNEWNYPNEQKKLLRKYKAPDIESYVDKNGKLADNFGIFSSPNTVIINPKGEEIGRINGTLNWDSDDIIEKIYKLKSQNN